MDEDETWYGGCSRSRPHCDRWRPSYQKRPEPPPNFRPMSIAAKRLDGSRCHLPLELGLGPNDIVLHGDPAPPQKRHSPQFSVHVHCGQTAGWIKMPLGTDVGLGSNDIALVHGQVSIILGVCVCLFVSLSVCAEFFSAVFDPISIKLGYTLYVWV